MLMLDSALPRYGDTAQLARGRLNYLDHRLAALSADGLREGAPRRMGRRKKKKKPFESWRQY